MSRAAAAAPTRVPGRVPPRPAELIVGIRAEGPQGRDGRWAASIPEPATATTPTAHKCQQTATVKCDDDDNDSRRLVLLLLLHVTQNARRETTLLVPIVLAVCAKRIVSMLKQPRGARQHRAARRRTVPDIEGVVPQSRRIQRSARGGTKQRPEREARCTAHASRVASRCRNRSRGSVLTRPMHVRGIRIWVVVIAHATAPVVWDRDTTRDTSWTHSSTRCSCLLLGTQCNPQRLSPNSVRSAPRGGGVARGERHDAGDQPDELLFCCAGGAHGVDWSVLPLRRAARGGGADGRAGGRARNLEGTRTRRKSGEVWLQFASVVVHTC